MHQERNLNDRKEPLMAAPTDPLHAELCSLGVIDWAGVELFHPRTRDREDIAVLRCSRTGVIFLDHSSHVSAETYAANTGTSYWNVATRREGLRQSYEEDQRRAEQIRKLVIGKRWLDVGCGLGGTLELLKDVVATAAGVEPQVVRQSLPPSFEVWPSLNSEGLNVSTFDVVTLFHVFEHLTEPLSSLRRIHALLAPGGIVLIEVPHARDALIEMYSSEPFKAHTFWSEHLVLHTRQSLLRYLEAVGFVDTFVSAFQRYPWANHLGWLLDGEVGGQLRRPELRSAALDEAYAAMLAGLDRSDTLIATGTKK
jgi:2-polyprenyl-3-methyl-5-hydroxy-6-metoxy-1,4-benzoquinol methylase